MAPSQQLVTVGYEGRSAEDIVSELCAANVEVLVDVRLTPLSRKPGLSKTKLAEHLQRAGIRYLHLRSLGNPKDNRDDFRAGTEASLNRFRGLLLEPTGAAGVEEVAALLGGERVALLCFEREAHRCHRTLIVERLSQLHPGMSVHHVQ